MDHLVLVELLGQRLGDALGQAGVGPVLGEALLDLAPQHLAVERVGRSLGRRRRTVVRGGTGQPVLGHVEVDQIAGDGGVHTVGLGERRGRHPPRSEGPRPATGRPSRERSRRGGRVAASADDEDWRRDADGLDRRQCLGGLWPAGAGRVGGVRRELLTCRLLQFGLHLGLAVGRAAKSAHATARKASRGCPTCRRTGGG